MRRLIPLLVTLVILGAFGWTLVFLYQKSKARPAVYDTALPVVRDIEKKAVASGALVPRREVTIKPRVSGVIEKLYVDPGMVVKSQALIAKIQIIPDVVRLNQAEANLHAAELNLADAEQQAVRAAGLRESGLLSEADFTSKDYLFKLRQEELEAAENNLQLVRVGASKKSGKVSNLVRATVDGTVIEVPVKEGGSVIEANTFNEGTTIAAIADMRDIIFNGRVDESDVGGLREGMPVSISVGALGEQRFAGSLSYISPKGVEKDGTVEFEIKAAVELTSGTSVRANYSANADIVLDRRSKVLAINESWVKYEGGKAFVEVETSPHHFEQRPVQLGLSDGIWAEVKSGVTKSTRVKRQETYTTLKPADGK